MNSQLLLVSHQMTFGYNNNLITVTGFTDNANIVTWLIDYTLMKTYY